MPYNSIINASSVISILLDFQFEFVSKVIDTLVEYIIIDIENPRQNTNQLKIMHFLLFSSFHEYLLIDDDNFYSILYFVISYGHFYGKENIAEFNIPDFWELQFSPLILTETDLPIDCTRISLIIEVLLNSYDSFCIDLEGTEKERMNIFLLIFQYYYYTKQLVLLEIEFKFIDFQEKYQRFNMYGNLKEVIKAITENGELIRSKIDLFT